VTIFKATCPTCGEVDLKPEEFKLRMPVGMGDNVYTFTCPVCAASVSKPADARVVQLLISAGVRPEFVDASGGTRSEAGEAAAPAFTYDDLLDFHLQLESDYVVESMLKSARTTQA
jgi:rRNA maturation protein Nop10